MAQQRILGFDRPDAQIRAEWLQEPTLRGFNLQEAEATLRQVLAFRIWFDQRRGWRYTNPNLEQLGMVQVQYLGSTSSPRTTNCSLIAPAACASEARRRAARLPSLLDHSASGWPSASQVLRHGRPRAVGREVAQPPPQALGFRHRREAPGPHVG